MRPQYKYLVYWKSKHKQNVYAPTYCDTVITYTVDNAIEIVRGSHSVGQIVSIECLGQVNLDWKELIRK